MYVGLKQPRGDGERYVTPARAAAKETIRNGLHVCQLLRSFCHDRQSRTAVENGLSVENLGVEKEMCSQIFYISHQGQ